MPDPAEPPPVPPSAGAAKGLDNYQRFADTVGGPSLRVKDNVVQAIIAVAGALLGALAGWLFKLGPAMQMPDPVGIGLGAVGGLIIAVFLSGLVLMILGWVRAFRK